MQLTDILRLVAQEGMRKHLEKRAMAQPSILRAGNIIPVAMGAMLPGQISRAQEKAHDAAHEGDERPFSTKLSAYPPMTNMGYGVGAEAVKGFGKELGVSAFGLLRDIASKAKSFVTGKSDDSTRKAIIGEIKMTDPVLSNADDKVLMEAYHTMTRFAPVLSTDKNAVRSFLRQAVMSGNGPDYMSIKLLADSERAVTGEKK